MIASERHLFDVPAGIAYFNTATFSAQLNASRDALVAAAGWKSHPWDKAPASYFDDADIPSAPSRPRCSEGMPTASPSSRRRATASAPPRASSSRS